VHDDDAGPPCFAGIVIDNETLHDGVAVLVGNRFFLDCGIRGAASDRTIAAPAIKLRMFNSSLGDSVQTPRVLRPPISAAGALRSGRSRDDALAGRGGSSVEGFAAT